MKPRTLLLTGAVLLAALSRLLDHPPNFTPVGALALFGAAYFRPRWLAFVVPLAALMASDVALQIAVDRGLVNGWIGLGSGLYRGMWYVYPAFALIAAFGLLALRKPTAWKVGGSALAASVIFFVVSNFGVWVGPGEEMYPHTPAGLIECYAAALPFFRWTVLGDLFYAAVLFGAYALVTRHAPAPEPKPESA